MTRRHSTRTAPAAVRGAGGLLTLLAFLALPADARASLSVASGRRQAGDVPRALRHLRRAGRADRAVLDGARACRRRSRTSAIIRSSTRIRTLCLLSLVFGGLLWPIAWLWAYTKPVLLQDGVRHRQASRLDDQGARHMTRRRRRPPRPARSAARALEERGVPATELEAHPRRPGRARSEARGDERGEAA